MNENEIKHHVNMILEKVAYALAKPVSPTDLLALAQTLEVVQRISLYFRSRPSCCGDDE